MANMEEVNKKIYRLYQLSKNPEAESDLQEAIAIIKYLRYSHGQVNRHRNKLREQRDRQFEEIQEYKKTLEKQRLEIEVYQKNLKELTLEKKKVLANLEQAKRELERIDTEVKIAVTKVKSETSFFGKFSRMVDFLRILFIEDDEEINELMKVNYISPNSNDSRYLGQSERDNL